MKFHALILNDKFYTVTIMYIRVNWDPSRQSA